MGYFFREEVVFQQKRIYRAHPRWIGLLKRPQPNLFCSLSRGGRFSRSGNSQPGKRWTEGCGLAMAGMLALSKLHKGGNTTDGS